MEVSWGQQSAAPGENSLNLQAGTIQSAERSWSNNMYHSGGALVFARGLVIGN